MKFPGVQKEEDTVEMSYYKPLGLRCANYQLPEGNAEKTYMTGMLSLTIATLV